jgi:shikimate dehydrogenase
MRAAVLGHPIAHSLSPVLHRRAYDELGLDWDYQALDVTADQLPGFLDSLDAAWVGLSLTMPLKEAVLPLLDEVEPLAAVTAAVNTVLLSDGRRRGFNTDVTGLRDILRETGAVSGCCALVVGAGATARSAVAALVAEGAGSVAVSARRSDAVEDLRGRLSALSDVLGQPGSTVVAEPWPPQVDSWGVVISTVPAHAFHDLAVAPIKPSGVLVDVIYDPWPTPLAIGWERAGGQVVGGLELLVRQAVEQVALMTGRRPSAGLMRAAGELVLRAPRFAQEEQ